MRESGLPQDLHAQSHSGGPQRYTRRATEFLAAVWPTGNGFSFIGTKDGCDGRWQEHPIRLRNATRDIQEVLEKYPRENFDLYFCPNPFAKPVRRKENALPTHWGWCDIDAANPKKCWPRPSIILRTSPGRYQGLWLWDKLIRPERAERYSHALTYRFGGDPNGWSITKYLRLPHTYNHKPQYDRPLVTVLHKDLTPISERPAVIKGVVLSGMQSKNARKSAELLDPKRHRLFEVYRRYGPNLHPKTRSLLMSDRMYESDRSKQIYMMVADLHGAGASKNEIAGCLWANPYFVDKYGQDRRALSVEVNRIVEKLQR